MNTQVLFYGSIQRAQTLLGCVQASITGANEILNRKSVRGDTGRLIESHVCELEEIEQDLVALINAAREHYTNGNEGQGLLGDPGRDVHGEKP